VRAQRQVVVGSHITLQSPLPAAWTQSGHAIPSASGYYIGAIDRNYTFTVSCSNPGGCSVGSDSWSLSWTDGMGGSGSLNFGSGYASPSPQAVDAFGMKVGLLSGMVTNGESFTVAANTPRDTFQYTINREPHAEPLVIVSYNDPQGNHRFIVPPEAMDLGAPTDNLAPFAGEMLPDVGVDLVARQAFTPGANTTDLLVNLPISTTLQDSHLFLEFINITGTVVAEFPYTLTVQAGPNVIPLDWDSTAFDPANNPEEDYIVMAFWTDYEGNILDTAGRPLSSFQEDPRPASAMTPGDETWDFGTAQQGTLMQRQFVLASVGYMDLLTYLGETTGVSLEGPGSAPIAPADTAIYTVTLNTQYLPVGPYLKTIPVRTSDPDAPERVITIQGTVTPMADDAPGGALIRPLDWTLNITGTHSAGEWITFTHTLGPDAQSLHPVMVYSQDYATLMGVGKYATDFGQGTASYDMFGDGRDGDLTISVNTTDSPIDSSCYGTVGTNTLYATNSSFQAGQKVLIHQSRGINKGAWEINQIANYISGNITIAQPLKNTYIDGGASQAQVLVVKQYSSVTVTTGVSWNGKAWNGDVGGIFAFQASGKVIINGLITADGKGFSGGYYRAMGVAYSGEGSIGESIIQNEANGNGGGGGQSYDGQWGGGGGGGNGTVGNNGSGNNLISQGKGGGISGDSNLSKVSFGGGGGGSFIDGGTGGIGGIGGGFILISGSTITVSGTIQSNGGNGTKNQNGGGGGGGGSILLRAKSLSLNDNQVTAIGGWGGGKGDNERYGGDGGVGRIKLEYCENNFGATNPAATTQKLQCYITEQVNFAPFTSTRLNITESIPNGSSNQIQYGRRYEFAGVGQDVQSIRVPKQIYAAETLQAFVSNTDVSSGLLDMQIDIGNDGSYDWVYNQTTNFPTTLNITTTVDSLNAYLVSRSEVAWGDDVDVPFKLTINRQADVLLTDLVLSLQFNQPDAPLAMDVNTGADRPMDWPVNVPGNHNQGEWITFTHTLGSDTQSLHPVKVYSQDYSTLWGIGKYATDFGEGIASYDMFGDGRDGNLVISSNTTDDPVDSSCYGTIGTNTLYATNASFQAGQKILVHQSRGTNAGGWEVNQIASYSAGNITTTVPLKYSYIDSGASQAQVVVVRQYYDVTVNSGVTWSAKAWDGNVGGILAVLSTGTLTVNGTIRAYGKGFSGGNAPGQNGSNSGYAGEGVVGGVIYGQQAPNGNGGGAGLARPDYLRAGGGGGGHGISGSNGGQPNQGSGSPGFGGLTTGAVDFSAITFGGGGGTGPGDSNDAGQSGGSGGGIVFISANLLIVNGNINDGGSNANNTSEAGPGGGGAGGSILLRSQNAVLGNNIIIRV